MELHVDYQLHGALTAVRVTQSNMSGILARQPFGGKPVWGVLQRLSATNMGPHPAAMIWVETQLGAEGDPAPDSGVVLAWEQDDAFMTVSGNMTLIDDLRRIAESIA